MALRTAGQPVMQLPQGLSIVGATPKARVPRRPNHTFHIKQYPYELTPFMIAPVLAGETMQSLLLQCRTVTTALKNRLVGHHLEHYFFYVKLRDLADATDIVEMLMDTAGTSVDTSTGSVYHDVVSGAPKWSEMCLDAVLVSWFRDEGDTGSHVGSTTGLPLVMWQNKKSIMESLIDDADMETDAIADTTSFQDYEQEHAAWTFMRQMQLTEMTFEDYLATFGVSLNPAEQKNKPELIRFVKNWSYPTNTVDGSGNINTQVSWSVQERADKKRFIKEPGFIVGYTVLRPKVYVDGRQQSAVALLDTALDWLPATQKENVYSSLKKFDPSNPNCPWAGAATPAAGDGQLDTDNNYWVDIRDLFLYGDEFTNMTRDTNINAVFPENVLTFHGKKYPHSATLQSLGSSSLTAETDGVVSLNILGTQQDTT